VLEFESQMELGPIFKVKNKRKIYIDALICLGVTLHIAFIFN
jgi:hypothetical protein